MEGEDPSRSATLVLDVLHQLKSSKDHHDFLYLLCSGSPVPLPSCGMLTSVLGVM
jgi:hypothetical protein